MLYTLASVAVFADDKMRLNHRRDRLREQHTFRGVSRTSDVARPV